MSENAFSATGNQMVADAMRQAAPDVMAAYPITPQTIIVETFAKYVADGKVNTEYVTVESEHSAMSACIGASTAGARVATATSSQGLALMWEELFIAAGMRRPIVMANANRALSAPINIHGDHSDVMGARDTGWIIFFAETAQEAYDNTIVSFKVAEDSRVLLPVMTTLDGFTTTHAMERCVATSDSVVADFVGEFQPLYPLLDADNPVGHGMFASLGDSYMKSKKAVRNVMDSVLPVVQEHAGEWAKISGRPFELVHCYNVEDADYIIICLGSVAGNARFEARRLVGEGKKVGVVNLRLYRPFPAELLVEACKGAKGVAVLERADALGAEYPPLTIETMAAFYDAGLQIPVSSYICGLGGADISQSQMNQVFTELEEGGPSKKVTYLGIEG
jgi:pyruvate ferredoxin oxidoreductase alpha subunit